MGELRRKINKDTGITTTTFTPQPLPTLLPLYLKSHRSSNLSANWNGVSKRHQTDGKPTPRARKRRHSCQGLAQKQLTILASQLQAIFGRYSFAKSSKYLAIAPQVGPDGLKTVPGFCSIGSTTNRQDSRFGLPHGKPIGPRPGKAEVKSDPNLSAESAKLFLREP